MTGTGPVGIRPAARLVGEGFTSQLLHKWRIAPTTGTGFIICLMSETSETPTVRTATATEPAPAAVEPAHYHRPPRVFQAAAWVAIVAGIVFIIAVIFFTGYTLGRHAGFHGGHHHKHHAAWMHHHGPGGPGGPGGFGPGGPGGPGGQGLQPGSPGPSAVRPSSMGPGHIPPSLFHPATVSPGALGQAPTFVVLGG